MVWVALIFAFIFQSAAFWLVGRGYCRLLLWADGAMPAAQKWLFVIVVYAFLILPILGLPLFVVWVAEWFGDPAIDRSWLYIASSFVGLVTLILATRVYRERMKQAGYWKD